MTEQEAINELKRHIKFLKENWKPYPDIKVIDAIEMAIYELEKKKHGNWFLLDECANTGVYCSVCHKKVYKADYANQKVKSRFCPNCGAIMDGKFEEL